MPRLWLSRLRTLYDSEGKREKVKKGALSAALPIGVVLRF
ncbi:hypothetical protein BSSX_p0060 (plasmid) [Bacillus subtilis]|nr:hypothetical protein BSSX_p0060 [Bacillus subtilis]